ncbi:hypothetical protein ACJX0J_011012, partial [Zea mays]
MSLLEVIIKVVFINFIKICKSREKPIPKQSFRFGKRKMEKKIFIFQIFIIRAPAVKLGLIDKIILYNEHRGVITNSSKHKLMAAEAYGLGPDAPQLAAEASWRFKENLQMSTV